GIKKQYNSDIPNESGLVIVRINTPISKIFPKMGVALHKTIHLDSVQNASPYLLAHEYAHIFKQREMGTIPYLWKYLTSKTFRVADEERADAWGQSHMTDPFWVNLANAIRGPS